MEDILQFYFYVVFGVSSAGDVCDWLQRQVCLIVGTLPQWSRNGTRKWIVKSDYRLCGHPDGIESITLGQVEPDHYADPKWLVQGSWIGSKTIPPGQG